MDMETPPFDFFKENYLLAPETYYKVGGPARWALFPRNAAEAAEAYRWILEQRIPYLVLGYGSNVLIVDRGFPGAVLLTTGLKGLKSLGNDRYRIECGYSLQRLVRDVLLANNYDAVGALSGIPASVGGAIFMNAGTSNGATCEWLETVDMLGLGGPRTVAIAPEDYSYRAQTFCPPNDLILAGIFRFCRASEDQQAIYDHYLIRRREKQPQGNCCGSVFKNPEGDHAGRLIEACGLKGTRHGGAVISPIHGNFIMNEDGASSEDILALIDLCKRQVREQFGIELHEEVQIIS